MMMILMMMIMMMMMMILMMMKMMIIAQWFVTPGSGKPLPSTLPHHHFYIKCQRCLPDIFAHLYRTSMAVSMMQPIHDYHGLRTYAWAREGRDIEAQHNATCTTQCRCDINAFYPWRQQRRLLRWRDGTSALSMFEWMPKWLATYNNKVLQDPEQM